MTGKTRGSKSLPRWTKKAVVEYGGRDPLGLSRVSGTMTDYLLSGIITTTDRARYYSYYCWALWHIETRDKPANYAQFVDGFRRRESMVALSTLANNPSSSPVGVRAAQPRLTRGLEQDEVDCDFRVLPANALGGFGQYYSGSMYQLGLTYRLEDGLDRAADGLGKELAMAFDTAVKATPYVNKELFRKTRISVDDLEGSQKRFSIDALEETFAADERRKLKQAFFRIGDPSSGERALLRRHTLAQILHIVSEYQSCGSLVTMSGLDDSLCYAPHYYGVLQVGTRRVGAYSIRNEFASCRSLWTQFCLHQFLTQALELLLHAVLETIGQESTGLRIDDVVAALLGKCFFSALQDITGTSCAKPTDLLRSLGVVRQPDEVECQAARRRIGLHHPQGELRVAEMALGAPEEASARAMAILATLYAKWRKAPSDQGYCIVASRVGAELWAAPVLAAMDGWLNPTTTWVDVLQPMIRDLIVNRHDQVMYEKRELESCWLHYNGDRLLKDQDFEPAWRATRHRNAVTIMRDLGLLSISANQTVTITAEGRAILNQVVGRSA